MEIPDKIYISCETDEDENLFLNYMWHRHPFENMKNIEYVRSGLLKEIDFEKELKSWIDKNTCNNGYCSASIHDTAEHFFELALNAIHKQKA